MSCVHVYNSRIVIYISKYICNYIYMCIYKYMYLCITIYMHVLGSCPEFLGFHDGQRVDLRLELFVRSEFGAWDIASYLQGWLSQLWSLIGVLIMIRDLIFRVPKKRP